MHIEGIGQVSNAVVAAIITAPTIGKSGIDICTECGAEGSHDNVLLRMFETDREG